MIDSFIDGFFDNLGKIGLAFGALLIALIVIVPTWIAVAYYHGDNANMLRESCLIEGKESINKSDSHEYRVYTDCGNFVVEDEMWAGNFHASDTYRELKEGRSYDLRTRGWRVPFFSMFPNIYSVETP